MRQTSWRALVLLGPLLSIVLACDDEVGAVRCGNAERNCGGRCVDITTDPAHCGACDRACATGETCVLGDCVAEPSCDEGLTRCGDDCVDLDADPGFCGGCDIACEEGWRCDGGACTKDCSEGLSVCGGVCVDTDSHDSHCGGCDAPCPAGSSCVEGQCLEDCAVGEVRCEYGGCVDLSGDPDNCGSCGVLCPFGTDCVAGECLCPGGQELCGGTCIDTTSDPSHCGSCDQACDGGVNASGICEASHCNFECHVGFADCDGDDATGCEIDTRGNDAHCGACDNDCSTKEGVEEARCIGQSCQVVRCEEGRADCNFLGGDGCETDLMDSVEHCGACGRSCVGLPNNAAAPACGDGRCKLVCKEGWIDCDGDDINGCEMAEAGLGEDPRNCGACGHVCAEGFSCTDGICHPDREWAQWPIPPSVPQVDDYDFEEDSEVVVDETTGLMWQRHIENVGLVWEDAVDRCRTLDLGGFDDWRMPTIIEVASIVALGKNPAVEAEVFPGTPGADFWSSTDSAQYEGKELFRWTAKLGFQRGVVDTSGINNPLQNKYRLRCVRAGHAVARAERYTVGADTVKDEITGLLWQRGNAPSDMTHAEGVAYCASLRLAGHDDWRLPEKKELLSLVDFRRWDPAIDEDAFPSTVNDVYWTASYHTDSGPGNLSFYWRIDLSKGSSLANREDAEGWIRCVR